MAHKYGEKWRVQFYDSLGTRHSRYFSRKIDADKFEEKVQRDKELVRSGLELPQESTLLLDFAQRWLQRREKVNAHGTVNSDAYRLKDFIQSYGLRPITSFSSKEIRDILDQTQEAKGWSNATRNRLRSALHKLFKDAFMEELIIVNPVIRVPILKEVVKRKDPVTDYEFEKLLEEATRKIETRTLNRLLLIILLYEGPRASEVCALKHSDFDLKFGVIRFQRIFEQSSKKVRDGIKGKPEGKLMPITKSVHNVYVEHLKHLKKYSQDDFVFCNKDGSCFTTDQIKNRLDAWSRRAGIRPINPHLLRSTFATTAEEHGLHKEEIQRLMGHSSVNTTELYTRMRLNHLIKRIEEVGFGDDKSKSNVIDINTQR